MCLRKVHGCTRPVFVAAVRAVKIQRQLLGECGRTLREDTLRAFHHALQIAWRSCCSAASFGSTTQNSFYFLSYFLGEHPRHSSHRTQRVQLKPLETRAHSACVLSVMHRSTALTQSCTPRSDKSLGAAAGGRSRPQPHAYPSTTRLPKVRRPASPRLTINFSVSASLYSLSQNQLHMSGPKTIFANWIAFLGPAHIFLHACIDTCSSCRSCSRSNTLSCVTLDTSSAPMPANLVHSVCKSRSVGTLIAHCRCPRRLEFAVGERLTNVDRSYEDARMVPSIHEGLRGGCDAGTPEVRPDIAVEGTWHMQRCYARMSYIWMGFALFGPDSPQCKLLPEPVKE
eukprot:6182370-Pleurochrysis_carterae.AAC.3